MAAIKVPVDGLSKLALAISGGGDNAYDAAFQKEGLAQSRMGMAIASMRKNNAEADAEIEAAANRRPEAIRSNAMTNLGIPQNAAEDVENFLQSGAVGKYQLPADTQGPTMAKPEWFDKLGNIGRLIASTQNAVTLGDKNSGNVADAYGKFDNINKQDRVISGDLAASKLGQAVAAAAGKPMYKAQEYGVLNEFTGDLDSNNDVAKRFGTYRNSETGLNRAQAGASHASADSSRASAELSRSKIGQSQTTTLPDGTVISSGGTPPKLTELQGKAMLFGSRAAEADNILLGLEGKYSPAALNSKQYAENTPIIGGALGAAGNVLLPANAQKAEQAQRDFVNAVLRLESGAVISQPEFENAARQYFPQPGDSKAVIEQKRNNRTTAINGLRMMAGPAAGTVQPRQDSPRNVKVNY